VKEWNKDKLLKWIQQERPKLLDDDDVEKFEAAKISGDVFLTLAGDVDSFKSQCNLPFGPSKGLANLAEEMNAVNKQGKRNRSSSDEDRGSRKRRPPSSLTIQRSGALIPVENQGFVLLKYPPLARDAFRKIFDDAVNNCHPAVIVGPYQCGKTTLLLHISRELQSLAIESCFLSLNELNQEQQLSKNISRFYAFVSRKIFGNYLSGADLRWRLAAEYSDPGKDSTKPRLVILIDELQAVMSDDEWFADAADFLLVLASLSIPFIGAGTFDSTKLEGARLFPKAIKSSALNLCSTTALPLSVGPSSQAATLPEFHKLSPVNKQDFHRMNPLTPQEMFFLLNEYDEFYPGNLVPLTIKLSMLKESNGHAASFMSLIAMYHDFCPSASEWPGTLIDHYFDYLNGIKRTTIAELGRPVVRDAVSGILSRGAGAEKWYLLKDQMTEVNSHLLDVGIISCTRETESLYEVEFTSYLIYRVCLHAIMPPLHLGILAPKEPIDLLLMGLRYFRPHLISRENAKESWNVHGASEALFHHHLNWAFTSILFRGWTCLPESRAGRGNRKRLDLLVSRKEEVLDAMESETEKQVNDIFGRKLVNKLFAGYELKVEKTTGTIDSAFDQASDYKAMHNGVDMYLVNFVLDTTERPPPIKRQGVTLVNIEYTSACNTFFVCWPGGEEHIIPNEIAGLTRA
jgi:hypothetical protein